MIDLSHLCEIYPLNKICKFIINGGSTAALKALLNRDASFATSAKEPSDGPDALRWAVSAGNIDMVQLLLEYKADPAAENSEILHTAIASRNGTREIVKLLLDSGAKVEEADHFDEYCHLHDGVQEWTPKDVYDFFVESGMKVPPTPEAQDTPTAPPERTR